MLVCVSTGHQTQLILSLLCPQENHPVQTDQFFISNLTCQLWITWPLFNSLPSWGVGILEAKLCACVGVCVLCACACIRVRMCVCVRVHVRVCMHVTVWACVWLWPCACVCVCVCTCTHVCICSAQSENLCNPEIVLHILRIPHYSCAIFYPDAHV